jgi:hypothetical protein
MSWATAVVVIIAAVLVFGLVVWFATLNKAKEIARDVIATGGTSGGSSGGKGDVTLGDYLATRHYGV